MARRNAQQQQRDKAVEKLLTTIEIAFPIIQAATVNTGAPTDCGPRRRGRRPV
jgi:hypothetical protein